LIGKNEINRAFAERLVGQVQTVNPRVLRLGDHGYEDSGGRGQNRQAVGSVPLPPPAWDAQILR
jgi:hypothetical protein